MSDDAILYRLNLIIGLLIAIIAILLWPIVSPAIVVAILLFVLTLGGALFWGMVRGVN
ncbi:hypothetical protein ACLI4U_16015 [Natrialbaceae archaeon A-CW2]|uniref:hypothetical protein n=1 Tax=Natronosalvus amylolyticus TaxID=2961994 RepID=UPI0020C94DF6|nr:hypothetical protein [Natronosalvus amylolyticus]